MAETHQYANCGKTTDKTGATITYKRQGKAFGGQQAGINSNVYKSLPTYQKSQAHGYISDVPILFFQSTVTQDKNSADQNAKD